jgi:hypothetical protein
MHPRLVIHLPRELIRGGHDGAPRLWPVVATKWCAAWTVFEMSLFCSVALSSGQWATGT